MHTRQRDALVTVRVTTLKGPEAGAYYVEALPSYYLDSGEPPARWRGAGAKALDLAGAVDDAAFLALMAGHHPGTGTLLGRRFGDISVRGFDVTASAPKSVSVLFALGDARVRGAVLDAHDTAVATMVDWIESHALTRYRIGGEVAVVDAEGIVAATFRQHSSRAADPQLHTHVVIPNRVRSPDGRWLALDARGLKMDQRTLSALYHAGLRSELRRHLGVDWRAPANGIAEMDNVDDDVLAEFSSRSGDVARRVTEKLERFWETYDREPTPRERWRLEREAVTDSRPAKSHDGDAASLHRQWNERTRALGLEPEDIVASAVATEAEHRQIDQGVEHQIVAEGLAALAERQSTWRPAELVRELAAAVPTYADVPAAHLVSWLDRLAETVVAERLVDLSRPIPEASVLRRDGRPVSESVLDRVLTTADILAEEESLLAWVDKRFAGGGVDVVTAVGSSDVELTGPQREVASAVAGTCQLVFAVGPAGAGKTTALAPAVEQLRGEGRAVFGVAPSATAAEVLGTDTGVDADTLDKLLIEHRLERPPDHRFDLPAGATVIVDEAAMVPTARLAELAHLAERRAWRVALVGDPLQFSAVGRGGMFAHLVETYGAIELDRVQRFAHDWERDASLRLRRGDTSVLELYDDHGRLHGGNRARMEAVMVRGWSAARDRGESVAMMAPTNEAVASLNHRAQQLRARAGEIDLDGPTAKAGSYDVVAGDQVATRRNDRSARTDRGLMVKNRDHWDVVGVHRDGGLTLAGRTGTVSLSSDYVSEHVELAYAETSHANQGRTVDRSLLLLNGPSDTRGIYVPMTRGRQTNEAFVVLEGEESAADVMADALSRDWADQPAVARRAELQRPASPPAGASSMQRPLDATTLRLLIERDYDLAHRSNRAEAEVGVLSRQLKCNQGRCQQLAKSLDDDRARLEQATRTVEELDRPIRRRRHRVELDAAHRQLGWLPASIERNELELAALEAGTVVDRQRLATAKEAVGRVGDVAAERLSIACRLEFDVKARAAVLGEDPPAYLVERLGQRPTYGASADLWDQAAGRIDQHRTAFGIEGHSLLGHRPRWNDRANATSYQAAMEAAERLDRALGRNMQIEPPARELGLSL